MIARLRPYLVPFLFFLVGAYQVYRGDFIEASLYILASLAFAFNSLAAEPKLVPYKKTIVIITWSLIIVTGILFLYLLQFKYL
jgi:hypothetical protein